MSCGNDGPWKAWKAKTRLPTLSTVLGKPATAAGFPHSHSSDDWSLFKQRLSTAGLTAEPKTVNSEGGPEQTAEVGQNHLPKPAPSSRFNPTAFQAVSFQLNSSTIERWRNTGIARTRHTI
jgi:hypothetical protein